MNENWLFVIGMTMNGRNILVMGHEDGSLHWSDPFREFIPGKGGDMKVRRMTGPGEVDFEPTT
jgi:hypothetical protein